MSYITQPKNYDIGDHIRKLAEGADFQSIAKSHNARPEDLILRLATEVKAAVAENASAALRDFEQIIGDRALTDLVAKLTAEAEAAAA